MIPVAGEDGGAMASGATISGMERVEVAHMLSKSGEAIPVNGERAVSVPRAGESNGPRRTSSQNSEIGEYAYKWAFAPASGDGGSMDMLVMGFGAGETQRESHCF